MNCFSQVGEKSGSCFNLVITTVDPTDFNAAATMLDMLMYVQQDSYNDQPIASMPYVSNKV